jgi:DNA-binding XRE family transcriptional regulator
MNIDPNEKDPFILLSSIAKKGPSSFVFEPLYERDFSILDIINFRKFLKLTTREFAYIFEISQSSINALERKRFIKKIRNHCKIS